MTQIDKKKNCKDTHNNMSYVRAVPLFDTKFLYDFTVENSKNRENGTVGEANYKGPKIYRLEISRINGKPSKTRDSTLPT